MNIERYMHVTLLALPLSGCSDKAVETGADPCDGSPITLENEHNYVFTGALDVPVLVTQSGADVTICWDEVTEDIQCHGLDPAEDIDVLGMVRFSTLTQDEVEAGLSTNSLQQSNMSGYVQFENDASATCTTLSAMSFFGTPFDVATEYTEEGGTYMMLLTTGKTLGVGARMISFLEPSPSSDVTSVAVESGCGILDFSVDLHSQADAAACTDGPHTVDWSGVTVDGQGNAVDPTQIDKLLLGFYEGVTVEDIEADFLDLEQNATRLWSMELSGGTTADLGLASDGASTFSGFEGEGVWLIALQCSRCYNPAPLVVSVLDPTDPS